MLAETTWTPFDALYGFQLFALTLYQLTSAVDLCDAYNFFIKCERNEYAVRINGYIIKQQHRIAFAEMNSFREYGFGFIGVVLCILFWQCLRIFFRRNSFLCFFYFGRQICRQIALLKELHFWSAVFLSETIFGHFQLKKIVLEKFMDFGADFPV